MGLNDTVSAERTHIGFFGIRNSGKSSLVNAVTGQDLSVVSDVKGTTTDPVKKAMELLPIGPVTIIDTPGIDDEGELGELRIKKTRQILTKTDIGVLVVDSVKGLCDSDRELIGLFEEKDMPYLVAYNKSDLLAEYPALDANSLYVSARHSDGIQELKERLGAFAKRDAKPKYIVADLLEKGDLVVLVIPVDAAAPKGRLILPQQQTIREILDAHCSAVACQVSELKDTLNGLAKKPKLVITDSQAFGAVSKIVPDELSLTSFSILFARYKGELDEFLRGVSALTSLKDGDKVLIAEGCTHHRQCGDIGTVKLPAWIEGFTKAKPDYSFTSGGDFPDSLSDFSVIIHCGGCMLNEREMKSRIASAKAAGVPIVNYGMAIAHMHGILSRSLKCLGLEISE